MFDWDKAFVNTNVNEKVFIVNKTILNILSNFFPHETLTIDDNEDSPWFPKKKKKIFQEKSNIYKSHRNSKNNNNTHYLRKLKVLQEDLHNAIKASKLNYYSLIRYKQKNTKVYSTLLKSFFNSKKMPLIPPLFHGNDYVTDFNKKVYFLILFLRNNVL